MAHDDKTEKPTAKRKKEARRKGNVPRSADISAWLITLGGSYIVPMLFRAADTKLTGLVAQATDAMTSPSPAGALKVLEKGLADTVALVLPVVCAFAVMGVVANVAQTGPMLSGEAAKPKFDKINPLAGLKRLFSSQSLWTLGKQVVKLFALVGIAYMVLSRMGHVLVGSQPAQMAPVVHYAGSSILTLTRDVAAVGVLLGLGDYLWQRRRINKSLKMTKREVKEEGKQSEGNPLIKGEIRKKQYRMSRARMMAAVAGSDVVVVNPTHFAVALRYEAGGGRAPLVVAKGVDELALRIREEAKKHKVPVIEDPPLARAVYAACDLDEAIPPELFLAVARLLAFVFTLPPVVRAAGLVHRRPSSALVG